MALTGSCPRAGWIGLLGLVGCAAGSGGGVDDTALDAAPFLDAEAVTGDPIRRGDGGPSGGDGGTSAVDAGSPGVDADGCDGTAGPLVDASQDGVADAARTADASPVGPPGLVYAYAFDGDAVDMSGHGDDGVLTAVQFVPDRFGAPGRAARFDGATSRMFASGVLLPLGSHARTVTAWVRPESSPSPGLSANAFVSWGTGDCIGHMFGVGDVGDGIDVWTGCDDVTPPAPLPRDAWTFVAVRFTPPMAVRVWTGSAVVDASLPLAPSTSASLLWVGAETTDNTAASIRRTFAGALDSLRIYDRALDDSEVVAVAALP